MASNHTQHYELSQWQATDEVVRTDFNADNAKIDAALFGKLGRLELISETAFDRGANGTYGRLADLDLSGVDWDQWEIVVASLSFTSASHSDHLYLNLVNVSCFGGITDNPGYAATCHMAAVFLPCHDASRQISFLTLPGAEWILGDKTFADITVLNFASTGSIPNGAALRILGLR